MIHEKNYLNLKKIDIKITISIFKIYINKYFMG